MHSTFLQNQKIYVLNTMIKKYITKKAPAPVGNYPHSVEIDGVLYLSGIGPRNHEDNSIPGNEYDMNNDFKKFNDIYNLHFPEENVCRTTVEVNALPTDIAVELKCIALVNK